MFFSAIFFFLFPVLLLRCPEVHLRIPLLTEKVDDTVEFCLGLYCYKVHTKLLAERTSISPVLRYEYNNGQTIRRRVTRGIVGHCVWKWINIVSYLSFHSLFLTLFLVANFNELNLYLSENLSEDVADKIYINGFTYGKFNYLVWVNHNRKGMNL